MTENIGTGVVSDENTQLETETPQQGRVSLAVQKSSQKDSSHFSVGLLINLKSSDSPSFPVGFIFPSAFC